MTPILSAGRDVRRVATPERVAELARALQTLRPVKRFTGHSTQTRGTALAAGVAG